MSNYRETGVVLSLTLLVSITSNVLASEHRFYKQGEVAIAEIELNGATMQPVPAEQPCLHQWLHGSTISTPDKGVKDYQVVVKKGGILLATVARVPDEISDAGYMGETLLRREGWVHFGNFFFPGKNSKGYTRMLGLYRKIVKPGMKLKITVQVEEPFAVILPAAENAAWVANLGEMSSSRWLYPVRTPWPRAPHDPVDVLKSLNMSRDSKAGLFNFTPAGEMTEWELNLKQPRLFILPCDFPAEYDLEMTVTRHSGDGAVQVGLINGDHHFVSTIGNRVGNGVRFEGGKKDFSKWNPVQTLPMKQRVSLLFEVRASSLRFFAGGKLVFEYKGDFSELRPEDWWMKKSLGTQPFIRWVDTHLTFHRLVMLPHIAPPPPLDKVKRFRKWTHKSGPVTAPRSRLLKYDANAVTLQTEEGGEKVLPIWDLSQRDQLYVRRFAGEGPALEIAPDALQRVKNATVSFRTTYPKLLANQFESARFGHGSGVLVKKTGNRGLIAVSMRQLLKAGAAPKGFNHRPSSTEVIFNPGTANEKVYDAKVLNKTRANLTFRDEVIYLEVRGDDLPEPVEVSTSQVKDGETVYTIGFPAPGRYASRGVRLGPKVIAVKMPVAKTNVTKLSVFVAQSDFAVESGSAVTNAEGKLLGLTMYLNCYEHNTGHGIWVSRFPAVR